MKIQSLPQQSEIFANEHARRRLSTGNYWPLALGKSFRIFLSGTSQVWSSAPERYTLKLPAFLEPLPPETIIMGALHDTHLLQLARQA
jgi:hypothetical protein